MYSIQGNRRSYLSNMIVSGSSLHTAVRTGFVILLINNFFEIGRGSELADDVLVYVIA